VDQKENRSERALAWYRSHGRDLSDLAALGVSLIVAGRATGDMPLPAALCALVTAALVPLRAPRPVRTQWGEIIAGLPRVVASVLTTYILLKFVIARPLACLWFGPFWPVVGVLIRFDWSTFSVTIRNLALAAISPLLRLFLKLDRERIAAWIDRQAWLVSPVSRETRRMAALLVAALWLLRGFMRPTLHGSADALWYGMNLADAVAQARAGVFPLFVGQSIYQFNGALCPIRIAPAFHYLGVTLDLLTFHAMGTFALQNLLLILVGVAGMGTSYATLRALLPGRPWLAAGLAALFLSCPGVLGVSYNTDLYMTWTTLPLIPLIWFATVRSFQDKGSSSTLLLLGSALGLSWWGHSPIALWSTFLAGAAQVTRLALGLRSGRANLGSAALGALAFGATAAYPVASVVLYPAAPATHVNLFQHAHPGTIVYFLQQVFPGAFLPLSAIGRSLGDFQFGYALWGMLLFLIWGQRRVRKPEVLVPTAAAALLALLLLPIPFLDTGLWTLVPGFVRDVTGNWPMSRLYFPLAGATVAGAAAAVTCSVLDDRARRTLSAIVAIGCLWSFSEAAKFAAGSKASAQPAASAVDSLRPENVQISRYSYSMTPISRPIPAISPTAPLIPSSKTGFFLGTSRLRWRQIRHRPCNPPTSRKAAFSSGSSTTGSTTSPRSTLPSRSNRGIRTSCNLHSPIRTRSRGSFRSPARISSASTGCPITAAPARSGPEEPTPISYPSGPPRDRRRSRFATSRLLRSPQTRAQESSPK